MILMLTKDRKSSKLFGWKIHLEFRNIKIGLQSAKSEFHKLMWVIGKYSRVWLNDDAADDDLVPLRDFIHLHNYEMMPSFNDEENKK